MTEDVLRLQTASLSNDKNAPKQAYLSEMTTLLLNLMSFLFMLSNSFRLFSLSRSSPSPVGHTVVFLPKLMSSFVQQPQLHSRDRHNIPVEMQMSPSFQKMGQFNSCAS